MAFAIFLSPVKNFCEEIGYFFKDLTSGKQECLNCANKFVPASAIKLITIVELYEQFQGKIFSADICYVGKKVLVNIPFIPTLKSGDIYNLFVSLPEPSFELYLEPKAVDQSFSRKYNFENCSKIFPLDFQTQFSFSNGKFQKEPIDCLPKQIILRIARDLKKSITINFAKAPLSNNCGKFPLFASDEIFRSIGSFSNNFVTDVSLVFLDNKLSSYKDGLEVVINQAKKHQINLEDAAGLSRNNKASCLDFFNYLKKQEAFNLPFWHFLRANPDYQAYKHLKDLSVKPIYAKTGTLNGVSSLVGKAIKKNSDTVFFCVMQNSGKSIEELKKNEAKVLSEILGKFLDA